ncbi:MAG TPA: sulfatase, partial [Planctomycetaceae bacterium]|nr:sulfatase [Planctomycetaceae bacterium]
MNNPFENTALEETRRYFLGRGAGVSLGAMAFSLLENLRRATAEPKQNLGLPDLPHNPPRTKNVIFLTQSGGPSQIELFDQ